MWPRQEGLQSVWATWHERRQEARETAFSVDEFGETEITEFDLDTAGITGKDNKRSFTHDRPLNEESNGFDVRDLPNR